MPHFLDLKNRSRYHKYSDTLSARLIKPYPAHRRSVNVRQALFPEDQAVCQACAVCLCSVSLDARESGLHRTKWSFVFSCTKLCHVLKHFMMSPRHY